MKLVCLDTNVLIWGLKGEATIGQEIMIEKAQRFLEFLDTEKYKVLVPSVVVGELLQTVPLSIHQEMLQLFERNFIIGNFDLLAASNFAKIYQSKKGIPSPDGKNRHGIKIDHQIIAIAISKDAECIYSHDEGLKKFAEGFVEVKEIPSIAVQLSLL
jgi:predicted nucleic acid-binding protein